MMSLSDSSEVLECLDQIKRLQAYIEHCLIAEDGSYLIAFHNFDEPEQFEVMAEMHLRIMVEKLLLGE